MSIIESFLTSPTLWWSLIVIWVIFFLAAFAVNKSNSFSLLFWSLYEGMLDFFADILGEDEQMWIKSFVTNLFFVILLFNLLSLLTDFFAPMFWFTELNEFRLSEKLGYGTSSVEFNVAMAIVWVLLTLFIQLVSQNWNKALWNHVSEASRNTPFLKFFNFFYEYVPFRGKGIITVERGNENVVLFGLKWFGAKIFDIAISLFVWVLDIIGVFAKVISLAFRLFGNMMSGTVLFTVLVVSLSSATQWRFWSELPLLAPIILFLQWLLVACIQAFVFPLLVAIFIKVARMWAEEEESDTVVA